MMMMTMASIGRLSMMVMMILAKLDNSQKRGPCKHVMLLLMTMMIQW